MKIEWVKDMPGSGRRLGVNLQLLAEVRKRKGVWAVFRKKFISSTSAYKMPNMNLRSGWTREAWAREPAMSVTSERGMVSEDW